MTVFFRRFSVTLCYISVIFLLCSCKSTSKTESFNLASEDSFPTSFIQDVQFINLDSSNPISFIRNVQLIDSSFYVLADNGLFRYACDGEFMGQISRQGRSEQEWLHLDTFFYSEKSRDLCLVDCGMAKIMHFSLDGDFLFSTGIQSLYGYHVTQAVSTEAGVLMANSVYQNSSSVYILIPNDEPEKIIDLEQTTFTNVDAVYSIGTHPISVLNKSVKWIVPATNVLREYSNAGPSDFAIVPTNAPLPDKKLLKDFEHTFSPYRLASTCRAQNLFCGYSAIFETEKYLFLASFNHFYTIVDKESKNCWVLPRSVFINKIGIPLDDCTSSFSNTIISVFDDVKRMTYKYDKDVHECRNEAFKHLVDNSDDELGNNTLILYTISQ